MMKLKLLSTMLGGMLFFAANATVHSVTVSSNQFSPSSLTINQGDTVTWTNTGGSHNVNGTTTTFPTNPASFGNSVGTGWTYSFTFTAPGTYSYHCNPHAPGMSGSITVNAVTPPSVPCTKPFFSEYIEGSSNNKGFEIYNPSGTTLDLAPYKAILSVNGGTVTNELNLQGIVASGDVYVVTTNQSDPVMIAAADTTFAYPSVAHFNGDDALFLLDTVTNDTVDIIGVVGVDPGSSWTVDTGSTANYTLVRKHTITTGQKDWTIGATEWDVYPQNTYTHLGAHMSTCVAQPAMPCTKPFFSEYIEGSSNNKGFEIYNPANTTLDLAPYKAILSVNGGSVVNELNLQGMVSSGDVYVVTTNQSDPVMIAAADTTFAYPSVAHFNGDDALFLLDTVTNDTVDIIGVVGVDPGSSWTVGTGSTANNTLVRKSTVTSGQKDWTVGATEWDVYAQNTYTYLGSHTSTCIGAPASPTVSFTTSNITVREDVGTVTVNVAITPPSSSAETLDLTFALGSNVNLPGDGSISPIPNPVTGLLQYNLPANEDTVSFDVTITDDMVIEGNETLFVSITALSSGLMAGTTDSMIFVVEDNDYATVTIDSLSTLDASLEPALLGQTFITHGVVYTDDFDENAGLSFYMYDNTGGINVFNFNDVSGYSVTRGDSIWVLGEIDQYRGLTELFVDSVVVLKSGVTLKQPQVVSQLDETTEGEYIKMENWTFADPTQWTTGSGGAGFNVDITNGTDTFVMRIDAATDLYNMAIPTTGTFHVVGAGSQFTFDNPADNGYQIFPRDSMDIITNIGINEVAELDMALYPNPVSDVLNVERANNAKATVRMTTITGAVVKSFETTSRFVKISVADLAEGVYILAVESDGEKATRKVIVR